MRMIMFLGCIWFTMPAFADEMTGTGFLANRLERTVQAELTGAIAEVLVEEGQFVRKGDMLAKMKSWALTRRVQRAEARYKSAIAKLRLAEAETKLLEQRQAWPGQAKPSDDAQYKQNEIRHQIEISKLQVVQCKEDVEANERELKTLLQMVERLVVRSPLDGKISAVRANAGDVIARAGAPLITVSSRDELVAHIRFPARSIKALHTMRPNGGAPLVTLHIEALNIKIEGQVATISQNVDTSSQTIEATIMFENKKNSLMRPGMKVTATLIAAHENSKSEIELERRARSHDPLRSIQKRRLGLAADRDRRHRNRLSRSQRTRNARNSFSRRPPPRYLHSLDRPECCFAERQIRWDRALHSESRSASRLGCQKVSVYAVNRDCSRVDFCSNTGSDLDFKSITAMTAYGCWCQPGESHSQQPISRAAATADFLTPKSEFA